MKKILFTLLAVTSFTANAQTYLIKIGDFKGDSQLMDYQGTDGWSNIYNLNLDITGNLQFINDGFVPAPGKAECGMIEITKNYNYQTSNNISTALHNGTKRKIEKVGLINNQSSTGYIEFIKYTFEAAIFTKFVKSVNAGDNQQLQENIGFKAESILIDYIAINPSTGSPDPKISFGWNFLTNTPI